MEKPWVPRDLSGRQIDWLPDGDVGAESRALLKG